MSQLHLWDRYRKYLYHNTELGLQIDISRMKFPDAFLAQMEPSLHKAYDAMSALEAGAIANPDENRMVGHYWLRSPSLSPSSEIRSAIEASFRAISAFASDIHSGKIRPPNGECFTDFLVIGIGGSTLGPQLVSDVLGNHSDKMVCHFLDNTDPDGIDRIMAALEDRLARTLIVVTSKSGGTVETRNGMLEVKEAYTQANLNFAKHAVAITGAGSALDHTANEQGWIATFPMWDWVGGRTSEMSAVGLLPAALQGLDITAMLEGARLCDEETRGKQTLRNPAAILALMWYYATEGRGQKDMVILPYKDRLILFSRYLQQLIMESLGKETDLSGQVVNQGISVYGNKGSTDQHAFVQQLREGVPNFFVTFIEVLTDRQGKSIAVEPDVTSGDFLFGFLQGTRQALYEKGRESITLTIDRIDGKTIGVLIALFERAVGFYASLIGINAYHQPGVEAGKKAATLVINKQRNILKHLRDNKGKWFSAEDLAEVTGNGENVETVFKILQHLSANVDHGVINDEANEVLRRRYSIPK